MDRHLAPRCIQAEQISAELLFWSASWNKRWTEVVKLDLPAKPRASHLWTQSHPCLLKLQLESVCKCSEEPQIDGLISGHENKQSALKELRTKTNTKNLDHVFGLKSQGRIFMTIIATFSKTTIKEWSAHVDSLPDHLFRFVRKACQQQLPTASNLQLWKKVPSDQCILCGSRQTNKHVLNNCSAPGVLERYKRRHDHVLSILAQWIKDRVGIESVLFADLSNPNFNSPADIFNSRRPDIVVQQNNRLVTLELTICHETNAATSRDYKISKLYGSTK